MRKYILIFVVAVLIVAGLVLYLTNRSSGPSATTSTPTSFTNSQAQITDTFNLKVNETVNVDLTKYKLTGLDTALPKFASVSGSTLTFKPGKYDTGTFHITSQGNYDFTVNVKLSVPDYASMEKEIRAYLGSKMSTYGVFVNDLPQDDHLGINENVIFPPASSAKMTIAVLVMRDIDAGKYTLQTTYPIQDKFKHSTDDDLGRLPAGTQVTIATYLKEMIELSNNTAWYHLVHFLGDSYEVVDPRTIKELGLNPLFMDPYQGTARNFSKLFSDFYYANTISVKSRDYIIDLMKNEEEFDREGLGQGLPAGMEYVNKLGYHSTPDLVNFVDTAIIWGNNRDYVVAVCDKNIDWVSGKINLKALSQIIYKYMDVK